VLEEIMEVLEGPPPPDVEMLKAAAKEGRAADVRKTSLNLPQETLMQCM
jgi:hypothetical protein